MRARLEHNRSGRASAVLAAICPLGAVASPARALDPQRVDRIKAAGELRVCTWPGYYAISFRNPRNGELQGIDIDLAQAFASDLGIKTKFVETSFGAFMDDLEQDRCDIAMFAIGDTPARRQRVDMSAPHLRSGMYAITTRTSATIKTWDDLDKPGNVIAVQLGTVMEPYMRANLKAAQLNVVTPPSTREEELLAGRADAFMTNYPYAQRMRFQHDWAAVIPPPNPIAEELRIRRAQGRKCLARNGQCLRRAHQERRPPAEGGPNPRAGAHRRQGLERASRAQWDISTGICIFASTWREAPPNTNSRRREWP